MSKKTTIEILKKCIEMTKNMTQEEFEKVKIERGIKDKVYEDKNYLGEGFELVLPDISGYMSEDSINLKYELENIEIKQEAIKEYEIKNIGIKKSCIPMAA